MNLLIPFGRISNYLGFILNALQVPELLRLVWVTTMTSQLLFIGGVICVHPISQISKISKTFVAFHPVPQACYVSILLVFFI